MRTKLRKALTIVVLLVVVAGFGARMYLRPGRGPKETVNAKEKGYVEQIEGTTVLHVKGTPYEMGYQHGALLRDEVRQGVRVFNNLLELGHRETKIPVFVFNVILDVVYRRCAPYIPERHKRELEGLADGAGVDLQALRRVHVISEVTERGCSNFAVFGKATVGGSMYHGRNFDWVMEGGLQDTAVFIFYEPEGGIPFATAGYAGLIGVLSGMNLEGLSIGQIGAITRDGRSTGVPLMILMRCVVEEARTLDEATAILASAHRTVGYNYVVADGDAGEARAYETTAHHCAVFTDDDPKETAPYAIRIEDAVFRADEAMDPTVRSFQKCSKGYPNPPNGSESYDHRYTGMAKDIQSNYGKIDDAIALEIVKSAAMRNVNLHSVLMNVTDREMWVAHAKGTEDAAKQTYVYYDLRQLLLPPEKRGLNKMIEVARRTSTP